MFHLVSNDNLARPAEVHLEASQLSFAVLLILLGSLTSAFAASTVTVSLQSGASGYNGARDTKLLSGTPTTNYGTADELELDGSPDASALLYWDLASIPSGSIIQSVEITVEVTNSSGDNYELYELLRPWVEGEATWSQYASGQSWQVAGADGSGDRGSTVLGALTAATTGLLTISLNASGVAVVQSWVNNPSSNRGFIILDYINASNGLDFSSRETATVANRPQLTVTYITDGQPVLAINDVTVTEGNTGTVQANFTVSLFPASTEAVTVNYATANGSATAGSDYVAVSGQVSFQPGQTSQPVTVVVNGDVIDEPNETFTVNLSNAVNATIVDNQGLGTIADDDGSSLPGEPVTFSVTGDYPYGRNELAILERHVDEHNLYSPADFFVHVGDILGQSEGCQEQYYDDAANLLKQLEVPAFIVIGDNEWPDCSNPSQGFQWWLERFAHFEDNFCGSPVVERQSVRPENWAFVMKGVLFVGINNTGTSAGGGEREIRLQDDADWVDFQFQDKAEQIRAAVVFGHAGPSSSERPFFDQFVASSTSFGKPVFYIQGHNHDWLLDKPWPAPNMQRLIVSQGSEEDPVQITVTMDPSNPYEIIRNPWSNNPQPFDREPCGGAGPTLTINDVAVTEGNSGTVNAVFTVTLSAASSQTVTVSYATANGTATAGSDYVAASGQVSFSPGQTSRSITVAVNGDVLDEPNETFVVNLSNAVNATIGDNQGTGTINDNDPTPSLAINDVAMTEGNSGTVNAVFAVTLSAASGQTVMVNYATANGSATAGSDYVAASGQVSFSPGQTSQPVTVVVNGDLIDEPNETFVVNLSNAVNATIADNQGIGTINDDDPAPSLAINDVAVTEGNSGTVNAVFTVTLSAASSQMVTVNYATANGSATAGSDYVAASGQVSFSPGQTSQPVTVVVNGDVLTEPNETFLVNLSNAINATIGDNQGLGTITNDDGIPSLAINDVAVTEGNSGTVNAVFTVTLSAASSQTVTVDYATANGSATAGSDYVATSGPLSFPPGETSQPVTVVVNGDLIDEPNETFVVNLSNAVNAFISDNQGTGTINDDDPAPSLAINDVAVTEGNSGTVNAVFAVTLSAASGQTVTVNYATADGSAAAGSDYVAASGQVSFSPGQTSQPVTVVVNGDLIDEPNETFVVNLSNAVNATIGDNQGTGTITDDDAPPSLAINDVAITEGNSGTVNAVFAVTLSAASGQTVTVNYTTADGSATAGSDYVAVSGQVSFSPGQTSQPVTVVVNGDVIDEPNETFLVNLSNAVNATIGDNQGTGTITNDDGAQQPVTVSFQDGVGGYTGTRDTKLVSGSPTTNYGTASGLELDGSPDISSLVSWDLTSIPSGSIIQSVDITVEVTNASAHTYELYEMKRPWIEGAATWSQYASGLSWEVAGADGSGDRGTTVLGALTAASRGLQTISLNASGVAMVQPWVDNPSSNHGFIILNYVSATDGLKFSSRENGTASNCPKLTVTYGGSGSPPLPSLAINDVAVTEGNTGTVNAVFAVTLSVASSQTVTVNYATANGSAIAGNDYVAVSGQVTFQPGETSQPVTVMVNGDVLAEPNETFFVNLSNAANANIGDNQGTGTINDDDAAPSLAINDVAVTEGNSGTVNAVFAVTLSAASGQTVTVDYTTADWTALAGSDYVAASGQVTFQPGETSQPVTVVVNGDVIAEPNETFFVNLSNAVNAAIGDNQGAGTITNDDDGQQLETVFFQDGVDGYTSTRDTKLLSGTPTTNYGTSDKLELDGSPDVSSLLSWDLTSIPSGSIIQSVDITVNVTNTSTNNYEFYQMKRPWIEGGATWNEYASGLGWEVAGADGSEDRGTTVLGAITAATTGLQTFSLNAAGVAMVQSWVDNPATNYGFIILDYINASNGLDFSSREDGSVSNRPKLTVTYSAGSQTKVASPRMSESEATALSTETLPQTITLNPSYPNPFNLETRIEYALPKPGRVSLVIYNVRGQQVRKLVDEIQSGGFKRVLWNGRDDFGQEVASGVYLIRLVVGQQRFVGKILLQK